MGKRKCKSFLQKDFPKKLIKMFRYVIAEPETRSGDKKSCEKFSGS